MLLRPPKMVRLFYRCCVQFKNKKYVKKYSFISLKNIFLLTFLDFRALEQKMSSKFNLVIEELESKSDIRDIIKLKKSKAGNPILK